MKTLILNEKEMEYFENLIKDIIDNVSFDTVIDVPDIWDDEDCCKTRVYQVNHLTYYRYRVDGSYERYETITVVESGEYSAFNFVGFGFNSDPIKIIVKYETIKGGAFDGYRSGFHIEKVRCGINTSIEDIRRYVKLFPFKHMSSNKCKL